MTKHRSLKSALRCFQLFIGLVLLLSAYEHLKNPNSFLVSVARYDLFSEGVVPSVAFVFPYFELVLGLLLIADILWLFRIVAGYVFLAFALVQFSAVLRGLEIDCGCFGSSYEKPVSFASITVNIVVAICFFASSCFNSADTVHE